MGLFLSGSGVCGASVADIEKALNSYQSKKQREFCPAQVSEVQSNTLIISESPEKRVFVLYPSEFFEWDELSQYLSLELNCATFSFHVHDGDLWMFVFFVNGEEMTRFNPIPNYWDDGISEEEMDSWRGDSAIISRYWPGVDPESIDRYFVRWNLDAPNQERAYPEDEFSYGCDWQMCDFIKKLGLTYPMDDKGNISGKTYHFQVE